MKQFLFSLTATAVLLASSAAFAQAPRRCACWLDGTVQ